MKLLANEIIHVQFGDVFKFNKQADGSLQVFGKATDETLDGDLQKCDLAWSAKAMEKWLSTGANMRVQHNPSLYPAGVGMSVDVKPDGVYLMAEIAEATAVRLVEKGALRAFSVGISRPKFARDASAPNGRIVGGDIVEVSLVDRPSNPNCAFTVKSAGKGDEVHFEGEYTRLPEISSPLNKIMNGEDLLTKSKEGDDGDDNDDSGNDVDESSAGDNDNNGDGGKDTPADSDADGKPDDQENDTHSDDSKDKSDKEAEADVTKQDFDGDTDGGEDKTDPADTPEDGDDVDTDGDVPAPDTVGQNDSDTDEDNGTETSTDDSMVDEIVEELVAEVGGGDGAEGLDDAEDLDVENKLQYAAMGATLGLDGDRVEWFLGKSSVGTKDEREGAKFKLTVDGETKFPINDCSDVTDAWGLRGHAKGIAVSEVEAYIRKAAKALDCSGPWDEGGDGKKTRFADWALRRLHDTTCPAFSNDALKHAYPSLTKGMDAAAGKTAQGIVFGMLQDSISKDGGEGKTAWQIESLAKTYSGLCSAVSDALYAEVAAELGLDKTVTPGDVVEAARDALRKDAEIDDTDDPGITVRTKGARIWYVSEAANAIGKNLQDIHDAVVVVQPDLCTLPQATEKPLAKVDTPVLTKAATVDERIDEITTAFDAERALLVAKIDKLSAAPDFTLLNTPRRRATGIAGPDVAKSLTVTDANAAAQEQERQARIAWYSDLAKSGTTREEREAAEELLEKLRFPDLTK